jgi:MgtC family
MAATLLEPVGEGWVQVGQFGLAFLLSGLIGLEREWRQKDAGLRTYTVVGIGSALFMLISKYGFADVVTKGAVVLDPSRVAAQIVSGLGFIGAGVIFVHRGSVKGLITAAGSGSPRPSARPTATRKDSVRPTKNTNTATNSAMTDEDGGEARWHTPTTAN